MGKNKIIRIISIPIFAVAITFSILFLFNANALASDGWEAGDVCVEHYLPGANCTANDVRIRALYVKELISACNGYTMTASFDMVLETESPQRYDIGFYIATDGGSAQSGTSCYHDYLYPISTSPNYTTTYYPDTYPEIYDGEFEGYTFTGFLNIATDGDACGDMIKNTQAIVYVPNLTVSCQYSTTDGVNTVYLIHTCASWDNNAQTTCNNVTEAYPGTSSKCGCSDIPLYGPTEISLSNLEAKTSSITEWLIPSIAAFLFISSMGTVFLVKKLTPERL